MSHPVNLYSTLWDLPELDFPHTLLGRRDSQDPDLAEHVEGFIGYITQGGGRPMSAILYGVIQHLQRVQNHLSVQVDAQSLDAMSDWAARANALIFLSDGSVRDAAGLVLVDAGTGKAHPDAALPYPRDAVERRLRTQERLRALGVPVARTLPPSLGQDEAALRSAQDTAQRALALLGVAVYAESLNSGSPISSQVLRLRLEGADFSPSELLFLEQDSPSAQDIVNHAWRYEGLAVLLWSIGAVPTLGPATQNCDVAELARTVFENGAEELIQNAKLRACPEILDALDLYFRLHWSVREARRTEQPPPAGLEAGVVLERHLALNWLTCWHDEDWDDVDTPT